MGQMEGNRWQGGTTKDISTSTVGPIVWGHMIEVQGTKPSSMERAFSIAIPHGVSFLLVR